MSQHNKQINPYRLSVEITNRSDHSMSIYIEPWGDEYELYPFDHIRVDILTPKMQAIPISYGSRSITVEGWEGTNAEVWKGGNRLN